MKFQTSGTSTRFDAARRKMLGLGLAALGAFVLSAALPALSPIRSAQAASDAAQKIADHFSSIRTMSGDFVQFGPRGEQTGGKFFIARPGRVRFNYEAPSAYRVISDGQSVVIDNRKLNTSDLYPLSKTPLKLLLDDRIDLSGSRVKSVREDPDMITIQLADRSVFGNSRITLMFDAKTYNLRQWTITDAQGKDTTVLIDNVQEGVPLDASLFKIDYKRNFDVNKKNANR
jgi:outer membrane lipoprotein-sorting protein